MWGKREGEKNLEIAERTARILYVLSQAHVGTRGIALCIIIGQIVATLLRKRIQFAAAANIELLSLATSVWFISQQESSIQLVNVRTDGAASFLFFSFLFFSAYATNHRQLLRRVCVRTGDSDKSRNYAAQHKSSRNYRC